MKQSGFTIVEVLIVIVIIAILAALAAVTYTGIQDRARYSKMRQDLSDVKKALEIYKASRGSYPNSALCNNVDSNYQSGWCGWNNGKGDSFIPGLVPTYASSTPTILNPKSYRDTYLYRSSDTTNGSTDGTRYYELIRYRPAEDGGLSNAEMADNPYLWTENDYDGIAWGFKSESGLTNW